MFEFLSQLLVEMWGGMKPRHAAAVGVAVLLLIVAVLLATK